jgi:hypothetical protein
VVAGQDRKLRVTSERREVIDVERIAGVIIRLVETRRMRAQGLPSRPASVRNAPAGLHLLISTC